MNAVSLQAVRTDAQILEVSRIAHEAWRQHYSSILSSDQIEYMLETIQSPGPIKEQIGSGYEYYVVRHALGSIGYVALKLNDPAPEMFLSKLYLLAQDRGKGLGRATMERILEIGRKAHQTNVWLTVNRNNPSIGIYEKMGFIKTREQVTDIGHGYVMDDYIMSRPIAKLVS